MTRLRCGMTESYLSALVDDALSPRARERIAVHVLHCSVCTEAVAGLRRTSQLLKGTTRDQAPRDRLADRLLAIPAATPGPVREPVVATPAVSRPAGHRAVRTAAAGLALVIALAGGTAAVGWVNAPAAETEPIADPAVQARLDYVSASAQRPLSAAATDVVMTAPPAQLQVPERVLDGVPIRPGAELEAPRVAELIGAARAASSRISYTGEWVVAVAGVDTQLAARVGVRAAAGEGTVLDVADPRGRAVQSNFLPAAAPSRLDVAATGAGELAAAVTAVDGQRIAGRDAVVVEHHGAGATVTRWWLDETNGLVLRREVWQGTTLTEAGGFTEVSFADGGPVGRVSQRTSPAATSATLTVSAAMALRDQGWYCTRAVGGLSLLGARSDAGSAPGVLALTYGDATRTVTVLQRPGTLPPVLDGFVRDDARGVQVRPGWPTMVTWQSGGVVFTVTSTASAPTTDAVVADLPHHAPGSDTVVDRIRSGWERVGAQVFG